MSFQSVGSFRCSILLKKHSSAINRIDGNQLKLTGHCSDHLIFIERGNPTKAKQLLGWSNIINIDVVANQICPSVLEKRFDVSNIANISGSKDPSVNELTHCNKKDGNDTSRTRI